MHAYLITCIVLCFLIEKIIHKFTGYKNKKYKEVGKENQL